VVDLLEAISRSKLLAKLRYIRDPMDAKGSIIGEKGNEASQTVTTALAMATASDSGSIAKETDTNFKHVECGPAQAKHETYRQAGLTEEDAEFLARFTAK
jgi:hypothetical protein